MKARALFDAELILLLSIDYFSYNNAALLKLEFGDFSLDKECSESYMEVDALFYTIIGEVSRSLLRPGKWICSFYGVISLSATLLITDMAPLELLECRLLFGKFDN